MENGNLVKNNRNNALNFELAVKNRTCSSFTILDIETMANDEIDDGSECVSHRCDIVSSFNIRLRYSFLKQTK